MELKKSKKANLERFRGLFFEIGMLVSLVIVLAAFEWGIKNKPSSFEIIDKGVAVEQDLIHTVIPEQPRKVPPPINPLELSVVPDDYTIPGGEELMLPDPSEPYSGIQLNVVSAPVEEGPVEVFGLEFPPKFNHGGPEEFIKWINSQIKYPEIAIENQISGRVFVSFVIDKKGMITNIKIARGVDPSIDNETLRVLKMSPKWEPGLQNGRPVSVHYIIPVTYQMK